jgi:PKD repeat protein
MQTNATASGLSAGDYYVIVTDQTGCVQIINVKVDSVPAPVLGVQVIHADCGMDNGSALAAVENGLAPFTFNWNGFPLNTSGQLSDLPPGNYQVAVIDAIGCTDTTEFVVVQLSPISTVTANAACLGDAVQFAFGTTSGATGQLWDFGDGVLSAEESPSHTYASAGPHQVTLLLSGGCMNDTVVHQVTVNPLPEANFTFDPEIPTTRRPINFSYTGSPVQSYLWDFGTGDPVSSEPQPGFTYQIEGLHVVTLIVTDQNGCVDTIQQTLEVLVNPGLFFPSAFVPEGVNTVWKGNGLGIEHVQVVVYSRNGNLVWEGVGEEACLDQGWDGNFEGQPAPQGVYGYRVTARFYNGMDWDYVGTITLIR